MRPPTERLTGAGLLLLVLALPVFGSPHQGLPPPKRVAEAQFVLQMPEARLMDLHEEFSALGDANCWGLDYQQVAQRQKRWRVRVWRDLPVEADRVMAYRERLQTWVAAQGPSIRLQSWSVRWTPRYPAPPPP